MFSRKTTLTFLFIFIFTAIQCIRNHSVEPVAQVRELTSLEKKLVEKDNSFGWQLFKEVSKNSNNENIFISPLSVSMALGMTYNGAAGETESAMKSTLNFSGMSRQEINESYKSIIDFLSSLDPNVQFELANSIWYRLGFEVEQDFIDLNKNYFNAEVTGLNFSDQNSVNTINSWVNDKTNNKIQKVIDKIDFQTMMFLINAIYFNGTWVYEFDKDQTKDDFFNLSDSTQVNCKMMQQAGTYKYLSNDKFQAVDLPYGSDKFRMSIFLPKYGNDLNSIVSEFNSQNWKIWTSQFEQKNGSIFLPKFKLEYKITLNEILKAMGMEIAFDPGRADFTNINKNGGLFISKVLHKTFVDVYEEGTEAAAVTVVEVALTSVNPNAGFVFRADRPFLFVIWENNSNSILFIGKIVNPS